MSWSLPALGEPKPAGNTAALRVQNAHLAAQARSAVLDLYSLDSQLATTRVRLSSLRVALGGLRAERATLRHELLIARVGERISEQQLASRVRQLYEQGEVSPIEVVFGASSIRDAMTQLDNVGRVASLNDDVLVQLRSARTRLTNTSQTLALRTKQLAAALRSAAATEASLVQARAARAGFIAQLTARRNLNAAQIGRVEAAARAAETRSQQLASGSSQRQTVAASPARLGFSRGKSLTVTITGYALSGTTATGIPVGWGVAAVDPRVIPLGTHIWIPGYGEAVAADVGGAIVGDRVDLWFPTVARAQSWGMRTLTIGLH